jgi:hypothetical protein
MKMQIKKKNPPFGGFGLHARRSAMHRSPSLERSVISAFPVGELRVNHHARLKLKTERGLILKADFNNVVVGSNVQFDALNDLAFGLWERLNALVGFLFDTLFNSHESPFERRGFVVRAAFVVTHGAARFLFKGSFDAWQEKSELPNNSESCPINRQKWAVIRQSQILAFWRLPRSPEAPKK